MTTTLLERPVSAPTPAPGGGVPARRAMIRWAWRLFRREWRQQLLILALIVVAVGATFVGAAVATNTPPPAHAGFGTALDLASYPGSTSTLGSDIAKLHQRFGPVDVIENQTVAIPGSINTYDLRAQDPVGPFGQPMLSLVSGTYPSGPGQVAITPGLASELDLRVGGRLNESGTSRQVVGIVQNPQSLLDEFALVIPGQVARPTLVSVLFDAPRANPRSLGPNVQSAALASAGNALNPDTIVLTLATLGMLLIALVAVGGFTVLAQRRLRSIGMLGALGATDRNIGLVVRANGAVVGLVGTVVGAAVGLAAWLLYRPHLESSAHHVIGTFALPWKVIIPAMILAVVATYAAASRPARAVTKVPILSALSGRPAAPKAVHRSAVPGVLVLVISFLLLAITGSSHGGSGPTLPLGLIGLIVAIVLLSPLSLALLARSGRRAPVAVRLALRDLSRYRSRSGSALAAISLGVLIAALVCVLAASRYGNVLDYAGPNMAANQLIVYTPDGPDGPPGLGGAATDTTSSPQAMAESARNLATALGTRDIVTLETSSASLQHDGPGRQWNGQIYVATPQLLRAFGISPSDVNPAADILTSRPGLPSVSNMQLLYGGGKGPPSPPDDSGTVPCPPSSCLANPDMQQVSALPLATSTPNTVVTEHAVHRFHLQTATAGWLIQTAHPLTAAQITSARLAAGTAGLSLETKNDEPTSGEIINWATVFGVLLALGVLAMTVGLLRSETASDLRVLTATGASSTTRRTITAATAAALGLLGAVLGTVAAYIATIAYTSNNSLDGLSSLTNIPARNLLVILIGMPLIAAAVGWLLAGREPAGVAQQPLE